MLGDQEVSPSGRSNRQLQGSNVSIHKKEFSFDERLNNGQSEPRKNHEESKSIDESNSISDYKSQPQIRPSNLEKPFENIQSQSCKKE